MKTIAQLREVVMEIYTRSIAQIEQELALGSLESQSPFLLVIQRDGDQWVYGEWAEGKGFRPSYMVCNALCGTGRFSATSAQLSIARLYAQGEKTASALHWRTFLQNRLDADRARVAKCVAEIPALN